MNFNKKSISNKMVLHMKEWKSVCKHVQMYWDSMERDQSKCTSTGYQMEHEKCWYTWIWFLEKKDTLLHYHLSDHLGKSWRWTTEKFTCRAASLVYISSLDMPLCIVGTSARRPLWILYREEHRNSMLPRRSGVSIRP